MTKSNPYTSQTAAGYNTSPPPDDGTNTSENQISWAKHISKIGDPIKDFADNINSQTLSAVATAKVQGRITRYIPASNMRPTTVAGSPVISTATTVVDSQDLHGFQMDDTTREHVQFSYKVPKSWSQGLLSFQIQWSATDSTATESVAWGMKGIALGDGISASTTSTATDVLVSDPAQAGANKIYFTDEGALTLTNATATDIQMLYFDVYRDATATADNYTGDALLMGVTMYEDEDKREDS